MIRKVIRRQQFNINLIFCVEIAPYNDTAQNTHKFTGHERDESTGYDYMHFRYYASTFGRFMEPDNVTGSPMNPQNWNLYSYVHSNPVNFNDPTGHNRQGIQQQTYIVNISGATWIDWKSYLSFYGNLYGGNVSLNSDRGGGGTGKNGYYRPIYEITSTSSDEVYWDEELQAWVGGEMTITSTLAGYEWVWVESNGTKESSTQKDSRGESLWERWKYNFIRTNKAIPGIMAPTGMGSITSGRVGALLEMPTFGKWLAAKCGGVAVAGIQWTTTTETVILASGTFVVNYLMVGVAFEAGVTYCWVIDSSLCY